MNRVLTAWFLSACQLFLSKLTAQDVMSSGLFFSNIPVIVFDQDYSYGTVADAGSRHLNAVHLSAGYDNIIRYQDKKQSVSAGQCSYSISYRHNFSLNRPHHGLKFKYSLDRSQVRLHSRQSDNRFESENELRSYSLSYSRDVIPPFIFSINAGRDEGSKTNSFLYGGEIRFITSHAEWGMSAENGCRSHQNIIRYETETIYLPVHYFRREYRFFFNFAGLKKTDLHAYYHICSYDSRQQPRNHFTATLDGNSEKLGVNAGSGFDQFYLFAGFAREYYDYKTYNFKNNLQYGKINVPRVHLEKYQAGLMFSQSASVKYVLKYGYLNGKEHTGLIIETWPFSQDIAGLLGVSYYNDLDGQTAVHSWSLKPSFKVNSVHIAELYVGWLSFTMDGKYTYRKQDSFFNVIDRGSYQKNKNTNYLNLGLMYQLPFLTGDFQLCLRQLIPLQTENLLSDKSGTHTEGGLFIKINYLYCF